MTTEKVKLSQVRVNKHNPRTITEKKMHQLVTSLLVLPSMLDLRPVVVDEKMTALGGNMRLQALGQISKMSITSISSILSDNKDYSKESKGEQNALLDYWKNWLESPTVIVARAEKMSEEEKKQFIVTDNASFGQWDFDKLANEWENDELRRWGVDVWQPEHPDFSGGVSSHAISTGINVSQPSITSESIAIKSKEEDEEDFGFIPELNGRDLSPEELPKIEGNTEVAMDRVIIVYPKDRKDEISALLGVETIDRIIYNIDDLIAK